MSTTGDFDTLSFKYQLGIRSELQQQRKPRLQWHPTCFRTTVLLGISYFAASTLAFTSSPGHSSTLVCPFAIDRHADLWGCKPGRPSGLQPLVVPPSQYRSVILLSMGKKHMESRNEHTNSTFRHPLMQLGMVIVLYAFHLLFLTQNQIVWPVQFLSLESSNSLFIKYRHFCGLGYDSLAGIIVLLCYSKNSVRYRNRDILFLRSASRTRLPWKFPKGSNDENPQRRPASSPPPSILQMLNSEQWRAIVHRSTFLITMALLVTAYFATGRLSLFWEDTLYKMSANGWSLTAPLFRAWTVLLGHLSWVFTGTMILSLIPHCPSFFGRAQSSSVKSDKSTASETNNHWFQFRITKSEWWMWVVGGYFVSSWLFNVADWANHYILPSQVLQNGAESSVVSQLVAPEYNDRMASIIGYIAPCITAPIWEEILYRGFLLAGLAQWTNSFQVAAILQAIVFSAHHMSLPAALPLAVLGWIWAVIYVSSGNLWTVCLIHSLWNSRVFLGSWLGL